MSGSGINLSVPVIVQYREPGQSASAALRDALR
jgi:hypothetical protein